MKLCDRFPAAGRPRGRPPTASRLLLLSISLCGILGAVLGAVGAASWVRQNRYWESAFYWLVSEAYAKWLVFGIGIGLAAALLGVLPVALAPRRRWEEVEDGLGALVASLGSTVAICFVAVWLVHHEFARFPRWRFWAVGGPLVVAGLLGWPILYRSLGRSELLRKWGTACFRGVVTTALSLFAITLALNVFHHLGRPRPVEGSPSIFLLTVDTQRPDHIGSYGYSLDTTPRLDRLAESARVYLNAFSHAPATGSAIASLLTGLRPRESGSFGQQRARLETNTMAEYLKDSGYRTAAVVSNPVLRRGKNYDQGFDHFDDDMEDEELNRAVPQRLGPDTTQAALAWLEDNAGAPLFLWVHYMDPHGPYAPPESYRDLFVGELPSGERLKLTGSGTGYGGIPSYQALGPHREWGYYVSQYDAEVRFFDDALAQLIKGIQAMGLWDNALVVLTSDHGEGMGEHDYYFAHGENLYSSLLHVPLIVWSGRGRKPTGYEEAAVVQHADLLPTVLSFAGLAPVGRLPGRDLLGDLRGDAVVLAENVIHGLYQCAVIVGETQVLYDGTGSGPRYYDLSEPGAPGVPEPPPHLPSEALDTICREPERASTIDKGEMDQRSLEILRSLGYVD